MKENQNLDTNLDDELSSSDDTSLMKTKESISLRKDSKTLLWSLKQHQNVIHQLMNHEDADADEEEDFDNANKSEPIEDQWEQPEDHYTNPRFNIPKKKQKQTTNSSKTVSFSDYLRTNCDEDMSNESRRRRSRSASPYFNKKPTKSILKKQIVQDELSEDDEDDKKDYSLNKQGALSSQSSESLSSHGSVSTNSLLCSDIYGGFNCDFDENIKKETKHLKSNKNTFIDFISKKRQAFLNHSYYEQKTSDLNDDSKIIEKRRPKESKTCINRSYSAENCTQPPQPHPTKTSKSTKSTTKALQSSSSQNIQQETKPKHTEVYKQRLNSSLKKEKIRNYKKLVNQLKKSKPLLGYDWAVDTLETKLNTTNTKFEKPESYWQELSQFRNQNKDECVSSKQTNFDGSTSTFFETDTKEADNPNEDDGRNHKCIHSYTLNDRLFPVPIYKGKNGQSACPVCKSTRKEATSYCPQFFKISIPKSRIIQPYKIQPSKRSDNKVEDTLSLAEVNFNFIKKTG